PSVYKVGTNNYVLYYAAHKAGTPGQQCIGRATATTPAGPFTDSFGAPLDCDTSASLFWSIDPSPFKAPDGTLYLLWRKDDSHNTTGKVVIRKMAASGTAFASGSSTTTLLTPGATWEAGIMENPAMTYNPANGKYYLFYSGNHWDTGNYAIGYATCTS